jgi:hypothetical protein
MGEYISVIDDKENINEEEIFLEYFEGVKFFKMKAMQHYFASVDDYLKNLK